MPVTPLPEEGLGYGIVVCGWASPTHAVGARALAGEGVRLVADAARAHELADRYGSPDVHHDHLELLARDDVDAVRLYLPSRRPPDGGLSAAYTSAHEDRELPVLEFGDAYRASGAPRRKETHV